MTSEKFCLRWNDFESNISSAFKELRDDKDFFDVTLACDDEQIQAHKVILSACSPFFRNILRRNPHQHPLLYLKGVKYTDLQSVLNFMYHGEVNVAQEELNSFLAVAEDLRVKGLTQNQGGATASNPKRDSYSRPKSPPPKTITRPPPERDPVPPPKRPRPDPIPPPTNHSLINHGADDDIQEVLPVKSEPRDPPPQVAQPPPQSIYQTPTHHTTQALATPDDQNMQTMVYQEEGYEDYGQYEDQYEGGVVEQEMPMDSTKGDVEEYLIQVDPSDKKSAWRCLMCGKDYQNKPNCRRHIETQHFDAPSVKCDICGKTLKNQNSYQNHMVIVHGHNKGARKNNYSLDPLFQ